MPKRMQLISRRKANQLTQAEMAGMLGVSRSMYSAIEIGAREPGLELAKQIADLFGTTVDELFFDQQCHDSRHEQAAAAEA